MSCETRLIGCGLLALTAAFFFFECDGCFRPLIGQRSPYRKECEEMASVHTASCTSGFARTRMDGLNRIWARTYAYCKKASLLHLPHIFIVSIASTRKRWKRMASIPIPWPRRGSSPASLASPDIVHLRTKSPLTIWLSLFLDRCGQPFDESRIGERSCLGLVDVCKEAIMPFQGVVVNLLLRRWLFRVSLSVPI